MPTLWDYIHVGRSTQQPNHNLQEGLFQIASQTCNILVQVNNTNNISYGNNTTNIQYNNFNSSCSRSGPSSSSASTSSSATVSSSSQSTLTKGDSFNRKNTITKDFLSGNVLTESSKSDFEQSVVLLSNTDDNGLSNKKGVGGGKKLFSNYRHRLSTVLESTSSPAGDDDFELWDQSQMLREQQQPMYKFGNGHWCKPSCIPITVILVLIILVVLLPLLDHANEKHSAHFKHNTTLPICSETCHIQLVESIPEGLLYPDDSPRFISTFDVWQHLIEIAQETLDISSYYWTLRADDVINHTSAWQGEKIFQSILSIGRKKNIDIRITQNAPTQLQPNWDTEILFRRRAADVRSVNFPKLFGGGFLNTKLWIVDENHIYFGSANMDWRALTQVKELGVLISNCSCLAKDIKKIFEIYWELGRTKAEMPIVWPEEYHTKYNINTPLRINFTIDHEFLTHFSSSPPIMNAKGRTNDLDAIINIIQHAEKFIHIAVMDYFPLTIYTPKIHYWPYIDNAIRTAAIENKVSIKLLVSWWNHSRPSEDFFLRSLQSLTNSSKGISIEIKRFIVPSTEDQSKIPYSRVNHNKYMVTERTAYIGTSNWSGDFFINIAGIGLILTDSNHENHGDHNGTIPTPRQDLENIFQRDWYSKYSFPL